MNSIVALPISAAIPTTAPCLPGEDPIFGVIERHRAAARLVKRTNTEVLRIFAQIDAELGPQIRFERADNQARTARADELAGGDIDRLGQEHYDEAYEASDALSQTSPKSLGGLLALLIYVGEAQNADTEFFSKEHFEDLFCQISATARSLSSNIC